MSCGGGGCVVVVLMARELLLWPWLVELFCWWLVSCGGGS